MAEPQIRAKLVIDDSAIGKTGGGMLGAVSGGGGGASAMMGGISPRGGIGALTSGIGKMLGVLGAIAASIAILAKASPRLQNTMSLFKKSFELILRPIGDVISMFIRPLAIQLLRLTIPLYQWIRKNLTGPLSEAQKKAEEKFEEEGVPKLRGLVDILTIWYALEDIWGRLVNWWSESGWPAIVGVWEGLKNWWSDEFIPTILEMWEGLKNWWSDEFIPTILEMWEGLKNWWSDEFIPAMTEKFEKIKGIIINPFEKLVGLWEKNIMPIFKETFKAIEEFFTKTIYENLKKAFDWFTSGQFVKDIGNWLREGFSKLPSIIRDLIGDIAGGIGGMLGFGGGSITPNQGGE